MDKAGAAAMQTIADEVLIARIAKGDRSAMEALFARYRVRVFKFVLRMVRNEATAEELNSDVFVDIWRQAGTFEGRAAVSTWIFSIARFKALNALARRTEDELDEAKAETIEDDADAWMRYRRSIGRSSASSIISINRWRRFLELSASRRRL